MIENELALGSAAALAEPQESASSEALGIARDLMIAASALADTKTPMSH
jgi:hypothetical protein